jgi:hypothetical protein
MLHLMMKASEERFYREQKHVETQFRMRELCLETMHQTAIETVQANFEEKQHSFKVSVCECFQEIVDLCDSI